MALVFTDMRCSLCRDLIRAGDDFVETSHFAGGEWDPFWFQSDSAMHRKCFDAWERRDEFVHRYRTEMYPWIQRVLHLTGWPGPPGSSIMPAILPDPPKVPTFFCPSCGHAKYDSERNECHECGWLRFPSNRANWGQASACPKCGFSYRWDGTRCSHCSNGKEAVDRGPDSH